MITLKEFQHKYCDVCDTRRCAGIRDVRMREDCSYYKKEFLGKEDTVGRALKELMNCIKEEREKETSYNLSTFIVTNFHHCPLPENCGINFETECTGWGSSNCAGCLAKYSNKLNTKES